MQVYLNGQMLPLEQATISPLDRGFLFGDGVYEVIPVFNRHPFELDRHLARLQRSFDGVLMPNPYTLEKWREDINKVIDQSPHHNQGLYIQVSRGAFSTRDFALPTSESIRHTIFMAAFPMNLPTDEQVVHGIATVSANDYRWHQCHLKTTALLGAVLLRQVSAQVNCVETILFRDDYLTEASSSNVFIVKNGELLIVPDDHHILRGITYEVIVELARKNGMPHRVRRIHRQEVEQADEIWLSSSLKNVLAVTVFDGRPVGYGSNQGKPGPMFKRMAAWFKDHIHNHTTST